ncbi:MAG: hypothetical protein IKB98_09140 [Clostridia bacterium]|nr:hypothetical protein [Clostridia bacterium]
MRKFLITLVSALIMCSILLSGCGCSGCSGEITLSFEPLFYGKDGTPPIGYKETCNYTVDYEQSFGSDIKKDSNLKDSIIKYDYSGSYVTSFEILSSLPEKTVSDLPFGQVDIKTDQRGALTSQNVHIYQLITRLDVTATYQIPGKDDQTFNDYIYTESYFTPGESGFNPIFTVTQSEYSAFGLQEGKAKIYKLTSNNKTAYNKTSYTMTTSYDKKPATSESYEYSQSTLIDNNQLLFTMRNVNLSSNQQYEISVVSYQYGEFKNLIFTNDGAGTASQPVAQGDLTVNGENYDQTEIKLKRYSYCISENKMRGVEQYVFYQNGENGNLGNRSVMYRYVEPLFAFGSYSCLGALVYTLDSITFN